MAQPFIFYESDASPERQQRQHIFNPFPYQMNMLPVVPPVPSTPIYSRRNSGCLQSPMQHKPFLNLDSITSMPVPQVLTPMASPQPISHARPAIKLQTEMGDYCGMPPSPPLTRSNSAASSPRSCDLLQTPCNPMVSGMDGLEVKPAGHEMKPYSPPLTPGMYLSLFIAFLFECAVQHPWQEREASWEVASRASVGRSGSGDGMDLLAALQLMFQDGSGMWRLLQQGNRGRTPDSDCPRTAGPSISGR